MENLTWSQITSTEGEKPMIVSEYVINELGVFVKREKRMPKKAKLTALTGFRIGYQAVPGTDYRAAPLDRNAILWHKIKAVEERPDCLLVEGNSKDTISLFFKPEEKEAVVGLVKAMRNAHPPVKAADYDAASWLCWRDDDDWGDPLRPLAEMIVEELETDRFIEPEILEETVLRGKIEVVDEGMNYEATEKFCPNCGTRLLAEDNFCPNCGSKQGNLNE